jgi:hypothetical protein
MDQPGLCEDCFVATNAPRNDIVSIMHRKLFLLIFLIGFLAACAAPTASAIPTPYPPEYLPTVIAQTAEAASVAGTQTVIALTPTSLPTRTRFPKFPTFTPTTPPTSTATDYPWHKPATIEIQAPGPMSKVISPINLRMNVIAGESEKVQVDLYGEDGRLLSRTLKTVRTSREGVLQNIKIPFEIRATAEVGRITISTLDKAGRLQSLKSVHVLMLSSGSNEINPPGNPSEPVGVFSPLAEESVTGGVLNVRGDLWPFNLQPVILELVGPDGNSIGLRILTVNHINPQLFETTIPYKVREPTLARLTIYQDDDRIDGLFYAYSQEVLLNP